MGGVAADTIQVADAKTMPLAPALPNELTEEVGRLSTLYLQRGFVDFIALVADDVVKLRRALRAACLPNVANSLVPPVRRFIPHRPFVSGAARPC